MARLSRLDIPEIPLHVIQRGNNRSACFRDAQDRQTYLACLKEAAAAARARIHAYVLMTNHVHLLATGALEGSTSRMMHALGRRYVGYFNRRWKRTGTLYEGRFKSTRSRARPTAFVVFATSS
jgi:putative transposase